MLMLEPTPLLNVLEKLRILAKDSTAYSKPTIDWYNVINNNSQLFRIDIAVWVRVLKYLASHERGQFLILSWYGCNLGNYEAEKK